MQQTRLTKFPFYIFLLPAFFIWHVVNRYFGLILWKYIGIFLFYYFSLSFILFFIGRLLFRNNSKAGCWTVAILVIFFFWGAMHDFLRSSGLPAFFTSYKFLFSFFLIVIVLLTVYFRKNKPPLRFGWFLTLLFGLFVLGEAGNSIYKLVNNQYKKNDLTYYNEPLLPNGLATDTIKMKPDIFLIILDEYASTPALQKYLHYDNSQLDSQLINEHFYVAQRSKSNYNFTPLSIGSMLSFQYFNTPLEGKKAEPLLLLQAEHSLNENLLSKLLMQEDYTVVNLGLCDIGNVPAPAGSVFANNAVEALYLETLWGRVEKEIWWHVRNKAGFNWVFMRADRQVDFLHTNRENFENVLLELSKEDNKPRFVYAHLMQPHMYYFYDRFGNLRPDPYSDKPASYDSLYIDQLIYTNSLINKLAKAANQSHNRPRVVIIAGDHGYRDTENIPATRDKQFMNLNAYYFSDRDHSQLYDSISPVNSFRIVLNKYFQANLPLLKDSTIRLTE